MSAEDATDTQAGEITAFEALSLSEPADQAQTREIDVQENHYWRIYDETGSEDALDECIKLGRQLVSLCPAGHPNRTNACTRLASSLMTRFRQTENFAYITEAISLRREVLSVHPAAGSGRAMACGSLAAALKTYMAYTGESFTLEEIIRLEREMLAIYSGDTEHQPEARSHLANSLKTRFQLTGDIGSLQESISLARDSMRARPPGDTRYVYLSQNLSSSLTVLFDLTGDQRVLDEVITIQREAATHTAQNDPQRALVCDSLAISLRSRYSLTGDTSALYEAVEFGRESLHLRPPGHPDRATSCERLAMTLKSLADLRGNVDFLHEAISLEKEALGLRPHGHPERWTVCTNLGGSFASLYRRTRDLDFLKQAISSAREALGSQPEGYPDRASLDVNLAILLQLYHDRTSGPAYLAEARQILSGVIAQHLPGDPERWRALVAVINMHMTDNEHGAAIRDMTEVVTSIASDIPGVLRAATAFLERFPNQSIQEGLKRPLLELYKAALDLAPLVCGFLVDTPVQLQYIADCDSLGPGAYAAAYASGDVEQGMVLLERARGMIWSQALQLRDPCLEGAPPHLASELRFLLGQFGSAPAPDSAPAPVVVRDVRHQQHHRVQQILQEIRSSPGTADFMRGDAFEGLASTAASHPVVVLLTTGNECHALIIKSSQAPLISLPLEGITPEAVEVLVQTVFGSQARMRGSSTGADASAIDRIGIRVSKRRSEFARVLERLWTFVVKPIIQHLRIQKAAGFDRPRLHWCPTGVFTFAPLHAAGIYDGDHQESCSDYFVSSYIPTLAALKRAQVGSSTFNHHLGELRLATVSVQQAHNSGYAPLPNVRREADVVEDIAAQAGVLVAKGCTPGAATTTEVTEAFQASHFIHIACHGMQSQRQPLDSAFCLSDGSLTVSQLMDLDLKDAFFAFLSACETAKGDRYLPDQTVHLAATMLFVGFKSVVATMWAMGDAEGPRVAKSFYEKLFESERLDADIIPYALEHATTCLRNAGAPPERWATFIHMGA